MSMWKWEAEGRAVAVVGIIHGAYEHHEQYVWLIERLRRNNFHVITGDLPGHRQGPRVHNESFSDYMKYVERLVKACRRDQLPFFLIGHGLGGTLLLRLLQQDKIQSAGVILTSPWLALKHQPANHGSLLAKIANSIKLDHYIEPKMISRNIERQQMLESDPHYQTIITAGWYKELQSVMRRILQSERSFQNIPISLLVAGEDHVTDTEVVRKWLLQKPLDEVHYKKWDTLRHDLLHEPEQEAVYLYIESFIRDVLRSLGYVV